MISGCLKPKYPCAMTEPNTGSASAWVSARNCPELTLAPIYTPEFTLEGKKIFVLVYEIVVVLVLVAAVAPGPRPRARPPPPPAPPPPPPPPPPPAPPPPPPAPPPPPT